MPKPADPTLKWLLEESPEDWVVLTGHPRAEAVVVDADIGTVSGAADKVIRVKGRPDWLLHMEFVSGHDAAQYPKRLLRYNTLLDHRHDLPVRSVAILLHAGADSPRLTGSWERNFPGQPPHVTSGYQVLRVWQVPVERFLTGGLGLLPLAPIAAVTRAELPAVIETMKQRLERETSPQEAGDLWTAADILMGLRYSRELAEQLLRGVRSMEESVTYQAILEKGEARGEVRGKERGRIEGALEGVRKVLFIQGLDRFGPPSDQVESALNAIEDIQRLEAMTKWLLHASSWEELLSSRPPRRFSRKKKPE